MTPEQVIRHNHNGGCPGGGVRVVPGELPGEDERIKKCSFVYFFNHSPIPVITSKIVSGTHFLKA
jgi:hypothetical protein